MKLNYQDTLLNPKTLQSAVASMADYQAHLHDVVTAGGYDAPEASLNLAADTAIIDQVTRLKNQLVTPNIKYIIDIGIGGSNLGTKAVYDSIYGYLDTLAPRRSPKMIFADTCNPWLLSAILSFVTAEITDPSQILITMISKSGGTAETVVNAEIILHQLRQSFPEIMSRVVIITDDGSKLAAAGETLNMAVLPIPKLVGGRFSVLSAVGLFPLAAAGIDIAGLLDGARRAVTTTTKLIGLANPAIVSAASLVLQMRAGRVINDNFFFNAQLESVGKWYRQLMGESVGKETDLAGKTVHAGITPTVSLGSTDLHSVAQLYLGGPRDKMTTFVWAEHEPADAVVPETMLFPTLVEHLAGKSASTVMAAIREGVKTAYRRQQLPFMEIILDDVGIESIGEYLQFKMVEMMYIGKLLNVNTFDQPNVELYKIETKKILAEE